MVSSVIKNIKNKNNCYCCLDMKKMLSLWRKHLEKSFTFVLLT
jgi:hypothetical protein